MPLLPGLASPQDLGHGNVGWHRTGAGGPPVPEVATPALDELVRDGVALERVYSCACCSPTRSSFISGRLPINVNILNTDPASFNVSSGEGAGVATMMTGIGEVLKRGGCKFSVHKGGMLAALIHNCSAAGLNLCCAQTQLPWWANGTSGWHRSTTRPRGGASRRR
eukprot:SAG22_NODE_1545_length_4156_cov_2.392162_5_plen_166_part_00